MKLYYGVGACSVASDIMVREAGLRVDFEKVDFLQTHKTESGADYLKINPKGYVPALGLDSGEVLTESVALLTYLADQVPAKELMPQKGIERYEALSWLTYVGTEIHKTAEALFNPHIHEDVKEAARKKLLKRIGYLDTMLEGKEYLLGSTFTAPDMYAYAILRWMPGFSIDLSEMKNVTAYIKRIEERPHVQEALAFEGLA